MHGNYVLVDDFTASGALEIETVREEQGNLVYSTAAADASWSIRSYNPSKN